MKKGATILSIIVFSNINIKDIAETLCQTQFFRNVVYIIMLNLVLLFLYMNLINIK